MHRSARYSRRPGCKYPHLVYICPAERKRRNLGFYYHLMPNASVNAPKQIRTASVTSVRASAQAYEQSIFRKLWEKKASRKVKPSGTPTLVNFARKDSTSLDSEVKFVDSSSDPEAYPGVLPLATSTPLLHQYADMASSSSSLQQLTKAAVSLLGIGVQGVTPLPTDTPLPQRSPKKTGQHSQLISLDSPAPGSSGQGVETSGDHVQDFQMDSQQSSDIAGNKEVLDVTVVSTASDWPDNVFFDSTRPFGSLPQHLQLTGGVPLPPEDSLRPTIIACRTLPPSLSPKPDFASKFAVKRNLLFGSPLKSAKSEGGTLSEMDSSDGGAGKPDKPVLTTVRKKKRRAAVDPATIQLIIDQLKEATLVSETHQSNTIAALNSAMEEISSLRSQVESLQAAHGAMAGTLDSATLRVANCETTLQHHSQQVNLLNDSHSRILSQWDSFQQKWANNQGSRGPAQDGGHAASFFLGGVQQLRAHLCLPPQTDPVEAVAAVPGSSPFTAVWTGSTLLTIRPPLAWRPELWSST